MKKIQFSMLLLCTIISSFLVANNTKQQEPLLVPVIMVKNEALVIKQTLQPYVDAGIKHFFVFDTGSTDDTVAVTQQFFIANKINNGVIKQEPFVNFEVSRNRAFDLAEQAFPNAVFMIMPDAEWYLQNVPDLIKFCEDNRNNSINAFYVRIIHQQRTDYVNIRLIRSKTGQRFYGAVHEYIPPTAKLGYVPKHIYFAWNDCDTGLFKSQARWERDLKILLDEYTKNPQDPRTVFYLAQTYDCLGYYGNENTREYNYAKALEFYKKRTLFKRDANDEEAFTAQYRIGIIHERMQNWQLAINAHLDAYAMRASRIEPLAHVADHFANSEQAALCYLFSHYMADIPYPENDIILVDKEAYEFKRHDLLAFASWHTKHYHEGKHAITKALNAHPELEYLQKNLKLFNEQCFEKKKNNSVGILNIHFSANNPGGIENHILIFNALLNKHGYSSYVLTSNKSQYLIESLHQGPCAKSCLTYKHQNFYPNIEDIEQAIINHDIKILLCHSRNHLGMCLELKKKYSVAIVYMHHYLFNFTEENLANISNIDAIVTVNQDCATFLTKMKNSKNLKTKNIIHIPPFFNMDPFLNYVTQSTKQDFFKNSYALEIDNKTTVITMVANMYDAAYKNHDLLLRSAALLKKMNNKIAIILAGDGSERPVLENKAKQLNLLDCVHFIGTAHNIPALLAHSDIHVLTSSHEGFGLAHLEAALMQKPFVAATETGFVHYIEPNQNGLVFINNNEQDLTAKLNYLIQNPEHRILMGKAAQQFTLTRFNQDYLLTQWFNLLNPLL